jgi:hypothetical protein
MKTKLLLLIVALFSFAASCETEEIQEPTTTIEETCECRKWFYTNQLVTGGFQFVYTHSGNWEQVPVSIRNGAVLQFSGNYLTSYFPIDDDHVYRWECKP